MERRLQLPLHDVKRVRVPGASPIEIQERADFCRVARSRVDQLYMRDSCAALSLAELAMYGCVILVLAVAALVRLIRDEAGHVYLWMMKC